MDCINFINQNWQTFSLLLSAIGGSFVVWQWRNSIKIKRAEFISQIIEKIRFDKEIVATMYKVTYCDNAWYNRDFHKEKEEEAKIDKLFSYLDFICYLKETNNISKKEIELFRYIIHRVCLDSSSQEYLWNLFHFSRKNNAPCSFQRLIDYGVKSKVFPEDFKANEKLYRHTLNF